MPINFITLLNLTSGLFGILFALIGHVDWAVYAIAPGIFFDFFDGFAARAFGVQGELGKQLDSLADVVTSGVAPGMVWFMLLSKSLNYDFIRQNLEAQSWSDIQWVWLPFVAFLCPLASAYRLAKFNIDTRQSSSFIGLPTPANALLIGGIVFMQMYASHHVVQELSRNFYVILGIGLIGTYMLNAELPMFSLKFKDYSWKKNKSVYIFLVFAVIMLFSLKQGSLTFIIFGYILVSLLALFNRQGTTL